MLSQRAHIARDIEHRSHQWAVQGHCPPGLSEQDAAYRWGGLGTNEIIIYYDLVRHLLYNCLLQFVQGPPQSKETAVRALRQLRDRWLRQPEPQLTGNSPPREVIERERRRLPWVEDSAADPDCPLCRLAAESNAGPAFTYLDGFHLDDDFAFSFCQTREDWEQEFDDLCLDADLGPAAQCLGATPLGEGPCDEDVGRGTESNASVWKSSYVNPEMLAQVPATRLFGVGSHLAELISDLNRDGGPRAVD